MNVPAANLKLPEVRCKMPACWHPGGQPGLQIKKKQLFGSFVFQHRKCQKENFPPIKMSHRQVLNCASSKVSKEQICTCSLVSTTTWRKLQNLLNTLDEASCFDLNALANKPRQEFDLPVGQDAKQYLFQALRTRLGRRRRRRRHWQQESRAGGSGVVQKAV